MLQIEYYLSRENLARDTFLVNQMNAEAYAPISLIAGFSKMKSFTTDMAVIMEAIKLSKKLEVDEAGTSVRPTDMELDGKKKTTIILREVAADVPEEQVRELFDEATFGPIAKIRSDVGGFWFIEMENEISSDLLDKIREKELNGAKVMVRLKTESTARTIFGAAGVSPTGALSPEGSPTAMSAAQAQRMTWELVCATATGCYWMKGANRIQQCGLRSTMGSKLVVQVRRIPREMVCATTPGRYWTLRENSQVKVWCIQLENRLGLGSQGRSWYMQMEWNCVQLAADLAVQMAASLAV